MEEPLKVVKVWKKLRGGSTLRHDCEREKGEEEEGGGLHILRK